MGRKVTDTRRESQVVATTDATIWDTPQTV
jgi:hypothetical protein